MHADAVRLIGTLIEVEAQYSDMRTVAVLVSYFAEYMYYCDMRHATCGRL